MGKRAAVYKKARLFYRKYEWSLDQPENLRVDLVQCLKRRLTDEASAHGRCILNGPVEEAEYDFMGIRSWIVVWVLYVYVGRKRVKDTAFCESLRKKYVDQKDFVYSG